MNRKPGKIRVLHVITRMILGGAQENTLYTVVGQQQHPLFDVTLLCGADEGREGDMHDRAREQGVNLVVVPWLLRPIRPLTDVYALWQLYRFMRQGRFDIVHTHSSKAGILGRFAARLAGVPIVVHTLHSLVFHEYQEAWKNRLYIWLKKRCAPLTDVLISVNEKTRQGAIAAGIGRPEQHVTIYSGMELEPFLSIGSTLSVADAKRRLGIPPTAHVVGKIARFTPLKGHDQFFEMAGHVAAADPDAWFLLVGDGDLLPRCQALVKTMGIADRTVFTGLVQPTEIPACIQAMDVVVHSSLREGLARVLPQAGAVGKPPVVFALDGAPEVVEDGVSGFLIPAIDTRRMAERVLELFADPDKARRFGEAARGFIVQHFHVQHMVERINAVYVNLLAARGLPTGVAAAYPDATTVASVGL